MRIEIESILVEKLERGFIISYGETKYDPSPNVNFAFKRVAVATDTFENVIEELRIAALKGGWFETKPSSP